MPGDEVGNLVRSVKVEGWDRIALTRGVVGSNGDYVRKVAVERLPAGRAVPAYLNFLKCLALKTLNQHKIARTDVAVNFLELQFGFIAKLAHQSKAPRRGKGNLVCAGLAQLKGVAAGVIDVKTLVCMLDNRDGEPTPIQLSHEICHERRLA